MYCLEVLEAIDSLSKNCFQSYQWYPWYKKAFLGNSYRLHLLAFLLLLKDAQMLFQNFKGNAKRSLYVSVGYAAATPCMKNDRLHQNAWFLRQETMMLKHITAVLFIFCQKQLSCKTYVLEFITHIKATDFRRDL